MASFRVPRHGRLVTVDVWNHHPINNTARWSPNATLASVRMNALPDPHAAQMR